MKLPKRIEAKNCAAYGECVKKDEQYEIVQEIKLIFIFASFFKCRNIFIFYERNRTKYKDILENKSYFYFNWSYSMINLI